MLETIVLLFIVVGVIGAAGEFYARLLRRLLGQFSIKVERKEAAHRRAAGPATPAADQVSAPAYPPDGSAAPEPWRPS